MTFLSEDGGETYNRCHFWSNFEIGSLSLWRSEAYLKFFEYRECCIRLYCLAIPALMTVCDSGSSWRILLRKVGRCTRTFDSSRTLLALRGYTLLLRHCVPPRTFCTYVVLCTLVHADLPAKWLFNNGRLPERRSAREQVLLRSRRNLQRSLVFLYTEIPGRKKHCCKNVYAIYEEVRLRCLRPAVIRVKTSKWQNLSSL